MVIVDYLRIDPYLDGLVWECGMLAGTGYLLGYQDSQDHYIFF